MADGTQDFMTARMRALAAEGRHLTLVEREPEPPPAFEVDRRKGWVIWTHNGLRLVHAPQFRALADLFADNGWMRNFNALLDAELALSAPDGAA